MTKKDRTTPLGDNDPFPFGKHKDEPMCSVPLGYLEWFMDQEWCDDWPAVVTWVDENYDELKNM